MAESERPPVVLSVGGSDSAAAAGIQADLKTFAALRVYGATALTAVTVQDTQAVRDLHALPGELVYRQIVAVRDDLGPRATKIGMLAQAPVAQAVARALHEGRLGRVVLDPILRSTSGAPLLDARGLEVLRSELLPRADVLTPNLPEAAALLGCAAAELEPWPARWEALRALLALGARAVVLKGGHAPLPASALPEALRSAIPGGPWWQEPVPRTAPPPDGAATVVVDIWSDGVRSGQWAVGRVAAAPSHGTGCTFAAAVAASLAHGWALPAALGAAQAYVAWALQHAPGLGRGRGPLGHALPDRLWEALRARWQVPGEVC